MTWLEGAIARAFAQLTEEAAARELTAAERENLAELQACVDRYEARENQAVPVATAPTAADPLQPPVGKRRHYQPPARCARRVTGNLSAQEREMTRRALAGVR